MRAKRNVVVTGLEHKDGTGVLNKFTFVAETIHEERLLNDLRLIIDEHTRQRAIIDRRASIITTRNTPLVISRKIRGGFFRRRPQNYLELLHESVSYRRHN